MKKKLLLLLITIFTLTLNFLCFAADSYPKSEMKKDAENLAKNLEKNDGNKITRGDYYASSVITYDKDNNQIVFEYFEQKNDNHVKLVYDISTLKNDRPLEFNNISTELYIFKTTNFDSATFTSKKKLEFQGVVETFSNYMSGVVHNAFDFWSDDISVYGITFGNLNFKKYASPKFYTVKYVLNGGKNDSSNIKYYNKISTNTILKQAYLSGCTFVGWCTDSRLKNLVTKIPTNQEKNIVLYAKWTIETPVIYTLRANSKSAIYVDWNYLSVATGYQVKYSKNKSMSGSKIATISGTFNDSKVIKNLSKNTRYYIQIRAYKKIGGRTVYSEWSQVKSVKTNKY